MAADGGDRGDARRLRAARELFAALAPSLGLGVSIRLWDGSRVPLGPKGSDSRLDLAIAGPGVLGALLRWPTPETLLRAYATGGVELHGGSFVELMDALGDRGARRRLGARDYLRLARAALPLVFAREPAASIDHAFAGDASGRHQARRNETDFIQFHYDVSNEFYALFLGEEMQYSCAYFTDWSNGLDRAQRDKLDLVCRKLRLQPGERFLDIGCGWGGLVCHAARYYGVQAHGVTLSAEQEKYAQEKIQRLGLADRVRVELREYGSLTGEYDKIASIGMFEHIGLANFPRYFGTIHRLLRNRGVVLNHGIASRSKPTRRRRRRITPEKRLLHRHVFPGSELTSIGHTLQAMEHAGLEIHDVEGLREHYGRTARAWSQRLWERRDEAIALVGPERYRLWVAYTAGAARGFQNGSMLVFQAVATKHQGHGPSGLPPTRRDYLVG